MLVPALFIIMIYYKVSRCSIPRNGYTIYDITIELTLKMTFQNSDVHPNTAKEHTPNKRRAHAGVILREEYRGGRGVWFLFVCFLVSMENNYFRRNDER